jgi:hypothetical protein
MIQAKGQLSKDNQFVAVYLTPDGVIWLAMADDEMLGKNLPFSFGVALIGGQWASGGGTAWDTAALTCLSTPRRQMVLIGPTGQAYFSGGGDRHEETIADGEYTPHRYGLIRDARTLDGLVFVCGMKKQVYRRDEADRWVCISQPIVGGPGVHGFEALDGFSSTDIYAVGWKGEIWRFNGSDWRQCDSPCNSVLIDVCCAGDGKVYALARGNTLVTGRGDIWSAAEIKLPVELSSLCWFQGQLYAASTRDVFVLDANGQFNPIAIGPDFPETCGALATNGVTLVSAGARDVFSFDGTQWARID